MASHAGLLQQHPGLVRMLFAELQRPATSPARETGKAFMQRFRLRLATLMGDAHAEGDLEPDLDPHELAALLVATQQGLMLQAWCMTVIAVGQQGRLAVHLLTEHLQGLIGQGSACAGPGGEPELQFRQPLLQPGIGDRQGFHQVGPVHRLLMVEGQGEHGDAEAAPQWRVRL